MKKIFEEVGIIREDTKKSTAGKRFVPSLTIAFFSTWIIESLTGIFLIDLALTFFGSSDPLSLATVSQLVTISSVAAVVSGSLLGLLSVRFSHRKLLLIGISCITLGTLGCFLAPNFLFMQFFYPIEGIGTAIVGAMTFTLVGEFLALNKRPKATGWIIAGAPLAGLTGSLIITLFFADAGSWRSFLFWVAMPVSLLAFIFAYFGIPSSLSKPQGLANRKLFWSSFKQVFLKKSSFGCLIGNLVRQAGFVWGVVFSVAFFRQVFGLSLAQGALIALGSTALFALGSIVGGQLVDRVGRKRLLVATLLVSSFSLILIAFVPPLSIALALSFLGIFIYSMGFPGSTNLTLEQVPEARGTMMSINGIFMTLGGGVGAALGGVSLVLFGYMGVILTFASLSILAAAIFFFLTDDPCVK